MKICWLTSKPLFTRNGYHVAGTKSCDEGLEIFYSFQPELVLLDINVGDQDGREMCKKIKSHAEYQHIPVILISANHDHLKSYSDYAANNIIEKLSKTCISFIVFELTFDYLHRTREGMTYLIWLVPAIRL